jgi:hypothetical protein
MEKKDHQSRLFKPGGVRKALDSLITGAIKIFFMKRDKLIYWAVTSLLSFSLLLAGLMYITDARMAAGFNNLSFPGYFMINGQ